ncbi:MAG: DctP family TRAP transporter solute-binding subunit [Syntrophaceae bacterium]|nr:DctP family TRAP transporter solute-binding subunit [Syntrophaceae bacterium]
MSNGKFIVKIGVSLLVAFIFIAFHGSLGWAAPITIKFAHGMPPDEEEALHRGVVVFKKMVEQKTAGMVKVDIYPANQLGKEREQFEGVKLGTIEMCMIAEGPMAGFFPEIMVIGIPYLYANEVTAWKSLDGAFGKALFEEMRKKTGVRALGIGENGFRNFTNRVRPIKSPEDMKGLKIRTMENPAHMAMVRALGASPTPIAWGEVYMALQQGVVDGQENPVSVIEVAKFNEVQKYLTLDGHVYSILPILINDKFFMSLTPDIRKVIVDVAITATTVQRGQNVKKVYDGVKSLQDKGMEIYSPNEKELQMFRERSQKPVLEFLDKTFTEKKIDKKWIDMALKSAKASEKD